MKKLSLLLLLAVLSGSASQAVTKTSTSNELRFASIATPGTRDTKEPSEVPPHRGMTKRQVQKLYGDPDNERADTNGSTWFYFFNRALYFVPFYYAKPRTAVFHFNEAGILVYYRYND